MSRRGGAFSAFQKTASQAEAAKPGDATSGSRNLIRRTAKSLNADEAKRLLESLRSASGQADFQKALTNLRGRGWGALKKREAVARLLAMAWKSSLKAAGFTIDQWGFPEMLSAVRAHQSDPGIRRLAEEVERQLKFQPGDLFGSKAGALKQTSSAAEAAQVAEVDVQVTITHPTDRDSVEVTVPASSTMKQVKEALAAKLKRPEVTRNGRMVVENPSGELLPVPDGQRLGGKRQVFMVGITLSPAPASPAPRGAAAAGTAQVPKSNDAEPKATRDRPLNLGEAKELLKAFREIASSKEFQRTLGNIHKQGPDSVQKMQPIFIAQSFNRTMAMYDFPLTTEGYQDMARGIGKHAWNVHVKAQAHEVERLLRMPPGAFFGIPGEPGQEPEYPPLEPDPPKPKAAGRPAAPKPAPAVGRAGGIEVVARHAVDNVEVRVELPQNATFYDCKQAISKLLGRDEILRKGRLVQKKGGLYSAYKDDDFVGETRQVLVLGADLQTVQPDEPMPPVHPYADVGRPPSRPLKGESDDEGPPRPQPYSVRSRVHEELEAAPRVNDLPQTPMPPPPPQLQPKPTPKPKPKPVPRPPQEYEITIKHAVEPGEVQLKIWSNWTFAAVRDALAKKLRREEIQKRARFVFKAGTGTAPWVAFKDDEIVGWTHEGHRREELMLLGVELVEQEVSSGPVSVELTRKLLEEFEKACAQEEVQAQLQKLIDRGGVALQLGLTQLMGQALQKVTDLVGVGRNWKLQRFLDTVKTHANDKATRELASSVEDRLRLDPGKLFGLAGPKKAPVGSGLLGRPPVELEEEVQEEGVPELSVQQAVALQRELHQGFSAPSFQQRLDNLENFHSKDPKLILLRQELFLSVQSQVLPKYGFRGDLKGVFDMLEAFKKPEFAQNEDFMRLGSALNALLRLTPDGRPRPRPAPREAFPEPAKPVREVFPEPKSKPPAAKPRNAPRNDVVVDIEVVVRHAVEEDHPDEEARFVVKSNATMKAVREALAAHLGKPELLKTCRLVQRVGENGAFSSFKDSEKLNSRRALLVLGVPSLRTASEEAEDQPSQWAQPRLDEPTQASVQPPEPPKLTLHQALALQRDLLQGFSDSTFQAKRKELVQAYKQTDPKRFSAERQKLFLSVQKVVLPRYGFEAGPKGVFDMLVQFDQSELVMNPTFQQQGTALNHLLFPEDIPNAAAPEATAAAAQAQQGKPPESKTRAPPQPVRYEVAVDMEVVVRHAVQEGRLADEEARFTVKSNATMKAVKEALASHLGKPELVKTCRLVQSVGDSAFSSFKDSEKLNNRRALLVMGVPSLRTAAEDAQEEKAGRTQAAAPPEKSEKQFQPEERRPAQASRAPRVVQPEAPPLTIPQALALQRDLLQRFSDPEFQSKRKELVETYKQSDPRRFSAERQKLFLSVQKLVLPRYGFEGSPKGVFEMMVQFDRPELVMNSTFQHQGATLNYLLFAEDLPEPSQMAQETAQETAPQAPVKSSRGKGRKQKAPQAAKDEVVVDIEVVLRHAVEEDHPLDEEARFTVKSNADMKQVKEALAAHLGKPELVKSCRLVQRLGENSAFTSFKDFEKLNNRRALLVLGVNSLRTASEDAQEEKERSARREEKPQEEKLHPLDREDQASPEATWTPPTRVVQPEAPKLTIPQALALQRDLLQGFSDAEFQAKRKELVDKYKQSEPRRFSAERQKLFLSVQKIVLPRYGFEAGPKGVFDMLVQFDRPEFASNPTFMEQGATLNYLLFPEDLPGGLNNAKEFLQAQTVERTPPRAEPRPPRAARKPRKAAEPHRLTPAQAVALQEDLRQGFADPTWQAKRKELEKTLKHSDPRKFSVERQKLFLSVQKEVLPKHGFEGSPKGVFEMMQQFDRPDLQINEDFQRLGAILNDLLFSEEPTGTGSRRVEPKEIEVTIRHALDEPHLQDEEAQLLVSTDATFRQLKEALAEQLEDPQVLQTCRFVRRVGESGAFSSFMESERLGKRRSLLVIGVQNLLRPDERSKRLRKPLSPRLAMAKLTPQQAVALQKELYEGFSSPLFRERLKKLWQQKPTMESRKYRAERQKLFLTVQSAVLPRYGLEGTERGVFEMLSQFDQPEIHSTEEFQQMGNMLNDLLYGGEPAVGAKVVAEAPKEVQVRVRRAGGDTKEEVHVTVPSTASMLDVRTAVARKCNASFLHEGRLVRNQGGVLVGYKDSEPLGGRRRLLFVGPPLWPEGAPIAAPEAPPAPVDSDSEGLEEANAQPGELTLENARRFLSKVKDACAGMDFQKQLMDIATKARQRADTALARMGIGALFISSCRQILRRFGFAHDRQGYDQMFGAIFPHGEDPEVFSLTRDIEKLLGVPPGSWFGIIREEDHLEETPQLTRDEAKRLIAEVRRLVAAPNFLRDIAAIRSRVGTPEEALQQVYMTLYQLLRPTALAFRLRGDPGCLVRMQEAIAPHLKDSKLRSTIHEVETRLLQVESGSLLGPRDGTIAQDTVKLRIRHAISDAEVRLTVPAGSTMGDILQALAKAVDDPNVLKQGRLVEQRKGGAFTSFQDSEQLGKRRRLLLLGVELQDASRSGKPKLTREQAVQLQLELLSEFSSASFQRRLAELKNAHPNGPHFYVERRKLILSVQTKVIPKFGFAGDLGGVLEMVRVLGSFPDGDGEMGRRGWEIERLIGEREELEATSPRKDGLETDASEEVLDLQEAPPARSDAETVPTDAVDTFSDFVAALDELDHEMPDDAVSPKAGSMAFAPNNTAVEADAIEHSPIEADTLEVSDSKEVEEAPGKADASAVEDAEETPMEDDALEMEVARLVQETPAEAAAVETEVEKDDALETEAATLVEETRAEADSGAANAVEESTVEAAAVEDEAVEKDDALETEAATLVEETPAEADSGAAEAAEESAVEASAADEHEAAEQAAAETEAEEADAVDIEAVEADAVEMEAAEAVEEEGDFKDTDGEEEEDEDIDEDWDEAARIVDEISSQIQEVLAATRTASKKEKAALLAQKRDLESSPEYIDALAYLEDPDGERRRRQEADAEASTVVEEVATQIAEVLARLRSATKKDKPGLLAHKRELENLPKYVNALRYLEDPVQERQRKRQEEPTE